MPPPPRSPPGQPSLKKHHQPWHRSLSKAPACFLPFERPAMELSLELFWSPPQGRPILRRSNGVCRMSEALKNLDHSFGNRGGGVPSSPTPIPSLGPGHSRVTGSVLRPQGRPRGRGTGLPGPTSGATTKTQPVPAGGFIAGGCALAAPASTSSVSAQRPAASVHSEIANVQTEAPAARALAECWETRALEGRALAHPSSAQNLWLCARRLTHSAPAPEPPPSVICSRW